jgi:hypothetical protein
VDGFEAMRVGLAAYQAEREKRVYPVAEFEA